MIWSGSLFSKTIVIGSGSLFSKMMVIVSGSILRGPSVSLIVSNVSSMMCHTAFSPLSKFYLILYVFNLVTANICVEFGMECLVLYLPIFK